MLPYIIPFSYDDEVYPGDSLEMMCQVAKGDKPMTISWSFHGFNGEAKHSRIRTKRISDKSSLLSIGTVTSFHSGNYTCIATNAAGVASYTTTLIVNGILACEEN